jgi:hypothetical protein
MDCAKMHVILTAKIVVKTIKNLKYGYNRDIRNIIRYEVDTNELPNSKV